MQESMQQAAQEVKVGKAGKAGRKAGGKAAKGVKAKATQLSRPLPLAPPTAAHPLPPTPHPPIQLVVLAMH